MLIGLFRRPRIWVAISCVRRCEASPGLRMVPLNIRSEPFVEVGGLHGLLHVLHTEHSLGRTCRSFKAGPHREVFLAVNLLVFATIHFLEVLCNGLVHLVSITDELVSDDD